MKKCILILCVIVLIVTVAYAVFGKHVHKTIGTCQGCGQTEELHKFVKQSTGDVYWYCQTCYNLSKIFQY